MDDSAEILDRLIGLHPKIIDLTLDRMHRILEKLGHPEHHLPPVVHIAGTNGKGSTLAFLRAMLEASGKRVHAYTSPHLVRFHERVRLAGTLVSEAALVDALLECERANGAAQITYFEITTAAALVLFSRTPADVLLLEVGLGGRLDATNVIDAPCATVITPVGMDHAQYLGDTIEAIAFEKAGILKRGCPAIVSEQTRDAEQVIRTRAAKVGATLAISGQDWHAREENGRLILEDEIGLLDLPLPRLSGRHQIENAGAALATMRAVFPTVQADALARGLEAVSWPARMQPIRSGALVDAAPTDSEIWLDGGHNADAGVALAEAFAALEDRDPKPLVLISAMLNTKEPFGFFHPFAGLAREVIAVPMPGVDAALDPVTLAGFASESGLKSGVADTLGDALRNISIAEGPPRILICGSLYFAGQALAFNGTPVV